MLIVMCCFLDARLARRKHPAECADHEVVAQAKEIQKTAPMSDKRVFYTCINVSKCANVLVMYLLCYVVVCPASSSLSSSASSAVGHQKHMTNAL